MVAESVTDFLPMAGQEVPRFDQIHGYPMFALAPDQRTLAAAADGGNDKHIRLFDLATEAELHRIQGHIGFVHALAFSPDGKRLVSASKDSSVLIWDIARMTPNGKK